VSLPIASTAVAGATIRECAYVRAGMSFHVFSETIVNDPACSKRAECVLSYLSSQRRRFGLLHCVHLKGPSPSLVSTGLCAETREEVLSILRLWPSDLRKPLESSTPGGTGWSNLLPSSSGLGSDGDIRSMDANCIAAYLGSLCHP
jgi:hypothetical protein